MRPASTHACGPSTVDLEPGRVVEAEKLMWGGMGSSISLREKQRKPKFGAAPFECLCPQEPAQLPPHSILSVVPIRRSWLRPCFGSQLMNSLATANPWPLPTPVPSLFYGFVQRHAMSRPLLPSHAQASITLASPESSRSVLDARLG